MPVAVGMISNGPTRSSAGNRQYYIACQADRRGAGSNPRVDELAVSVLQGATPDTHDRPVSISNPSETHCKSYRSRQSHQRPRCSTPRSPDARGRCMTGLPEAARRRVSAIDYGRDRRGAPCRHRGTQAVSARVVSIARSIRRERIRPGSRSLPPDPCNRSDLRRPTDPIETEQGFR